MATRPAYHHGNLRNALIAAGVELAREHGPDAVVVREASRRVGVSHNAAYRHFPDRDSLLRAVAERSMAALARRMEERIAKVDPGDASADAARRRVRATGEAYIAFATEEPGWFRAAFAIPDSKHQLVEDDHEGVGDSGLGPYGLLNAQLDGLLNAGGITQSQRENADTVAWAAVHGLSMLLIDGPLRELPKAERKRVIERMLDTIEAGWAGLEP